MGRRTLFFGISISVFTFFILIPVTIGSILQIGDGSGSIGTFYQNIFNEFKSNYYFVFIQILVVFIGIWYVGPKLPQQILEKKRNYFWTTVIIIMFLWILLFISSSITAGIQNSIKYGLKGFESAVTNWFIFGFFSFMIMGLFHSLVISFFIGKKIKEKGKHFNESKN